MRCARLCHGLPTKRRISRPRAARHPRHAVAIDALEQVGVVRDAVERGAREGRSRLDEARQNRRRHDALADLGEIVLELIRAGEIDIAELPVVRSGVRDLAELDAGAGAGPRGRRDRDRDDRDDDDALRDIARAPSRSRFDERGPRPSELRGRTGGAARSDDGTVPASSSTGSSRWSQVRAAGAAATAAAVRVWRPPAEHLHAAPDDDAAADHASPAAAPDPRRARGIADPLRKGGISFDDDDLNEYMHPDDVPPRDPGSDGDA